MGRFCLLSFLFHFHPLVSLCSFEPHHSFPFSVFPFRPHTLSIIPPSLCLLPLLLGSIFLSSLITSLSSLSCRHPLASKWKHFLFIFGVFKNRSSLPLLRPTSALFLCCCSSISYTEAWEGNERLVLWGVTGSPLPPSEPPINQHPNIQLGTGAHRNVPFLSSLLHLWPGASFRSWRAVLEVKGPGG